MMRCELAILLGLCLLAAALPAHADDKAPHVVFVTGDDEYRSEISMPMIADILRERHGFRCTVLYATDEQGNRNPKYRQSIPGLEVLKDADLAVFFMRFRVLPDDQMQHILDYIASGKPAVGLRTTTHAFQYPGGHKFAAYNNDFGIQVFGQRWISHHGHNSSTIVTVAPDQKQHPILRGVEPEFFCRSWLYNVTPLVGECDVLLLGDAVKGETPDGQRFGQRNPVAWTKTSPKGGRVFFTTLGHPKDFSDQSMRRLLVNGIYWALGRDIPKEGTNVQTVGKYEAPNTH